MIQRVIQKNMEGTEIENKIYKSVSPLQQAKSSIFVKLVSLTWLYEDKTSTQWSHYCEEEFYSEDCHRPEL